MTITPRKPSAPVPRSGTTIGLTVASLAAGVVIWQLLSLALPSIISGPSQVIAIAISQRSAVVTNLAYSLARVLIGFGVGLAVAIPAGFVLSWYRPLRLLVDPWIQFFRMIPPIALIPLVIIYFGIGELAKIFVIFFASFLVMLIAVYQGTKQVEEAWVRAARVLGASDLVIFTRVILPGSVPAILTAMRIGIATAWTTLVAAELVAASHGLGYMIMQASQYFDMSTVYLGIVLIGLIGFGMDRAILALERRVTSWRESYDR